ncbi:hypothetical protein [Massilia sp. Mn16-1_5]|uniref:hypothetical protein n=1 Tax=Massilia sp. Mn16-1_5 TaxID=2079199 RepID=UPI00109EA8EB|nr:hypothetical protein [Massilia sp. Mn16-1_5]
MACVPRFRESGFNRRPFGCHRYDVYSPKLHRQITLFGRHALDLWITLEASSSVLSYCERPIIIPGSRPVRAFDFWVQRAEGEELLVLMRNQVQKSSDNEEPASDIQSLSGTSVEGIPIRCIDPGDMTDHQITLANWGSIIRDLAAFERFIPEPLCNDVKARLDTRKSIAQLQSELSDFDASTVRLAIFQLLHRGEAVCSELATHRLTRNHVIARP